MQIINEFVKTKSTSFRRYIAEQSIFLLFQNIPTVFGLIARGIVYRMILRSSGLCGIEEYVQITHPRKLQLGKNVFIGKNSFLGASDGGIIIGDNACLVANCYLNVFNYFENTGNKIVIGKNVVISSGCVIHGHSGVTIGDNTIIGPNTSLVTGNHGDLTADKAAPTYRFAKIVTTTPISVGTNVWIGTNVSILPGISIGDNSVIGAGSIVTKDVPANSVYAGNPAREIRKLNL